MKLFGKYLSLFWVPIVLCTSLSLAMIFFFHGGVFSLLNVLFLWTMHFTGWVAGRYSVMQWVAELVNKRFDEIQEVKETPTQIDK